MGRIPPLALGNVVASLKDWNGSTTDIHSDVRGWPQPTTIFTGWRMQRALRTSVFMYSYITQFQYHIIRNYGNNITCIMLIN